MKRIPTVIGYGLDGIPVAPALVPNATGMGFTTAEVTSGFLLGQPPFDPNPAGAIRSPKSLPAVMAERFLHAAALPVADGLLIAGHTIRLDDGVQRLDPFPAALNVRGALIPAFAPSESFYRVLRMSDQQLEHFVRGRLVLVGLQARELGSDIVTPAGIFPGAFVNLRLVDQLLRLRSVWEAPRSAEIGLVLILPLAAFAFALWFRAVASVAITFAMCIGEAFLCAFSYLQSGLYFDILHATTAAVLVGFVTSGVVERQRILVDRETRRELAIREQELVTERATSAVLAEHNAALQRFVPREFLEHLNRESILDVELGDQVQRSMTILFSDIRDFTELSERLTPQATFDFLNAYLGRIGPIVRAHGGFIDKYIGDAIMGLFPTAGDEALRAAIALHDEVRRYDADRERLGQPAIVAGVGLHHGSLILGTIGELQRMDTTVIADAVNVAARIEGLTKIFGAAILVSEAFIDTLENPPAFTMRSLGAVRVQGKLDSVAIFEVIDGDAADVREQKRPALDMFAAALTDFQAGRFAAAMSGFDMAIAACPADRPARYFRSRCDVLAVQSPASWDGIETVATK